MNVVLGSIFRNSVRYIPRYYAQAQSLAHALVARGDSLRMVLVEGDSGDRTWEALLSDRPSDVPLLRVKREHGGPAWGSVDAPDRWKALSFCCNGVLDNLLETDDAVVYVESDLIWETGDMLRLLDQLSDAHPAIASLCFTKSGLFYDTWGHRKDGVPFGPFPPYHRDLDTRPGRLTEIDSAGSCIVMRGDVARAARFGPDDCVLGLGRSIREHGFRLYVDPAAKVVHP
jgi:hypothetical protein